MSPIREPRVCAVDGCEVEFIPVRRQIYCNYKCRNRACNMKRPFVAGQKHDWKRHYGVTPDIYRYLVERAGGKCSICRTTNPGKGVNHWSIDHDHSTGDLRGILCRRCNTGLGMFGDKLYLVRAAADYLSQAPAVYGMHL